MITIQQYVDKSQNKNGKKSTYKLNDIKINFSFQIDVIIGKKTSQGASFEQRFQLTTDE